MSKTNTKKQPAAKLNVAELEEFATAVLGRNPFAIDRITEPSQLESDVTAIHQIEFDRLTSRAQQACARNSSLGALLLGGAGVGKSHLLARFARWAKSGNAFFVFLHNIKVNPDDIDRYLLKCIVTKLVEDRLERLKETSLFQIVQAAVQQAAREVGITTVNDATLKDVSEKLAQRIGGDKDVFEVIFTFFHSAALSTDGKTKEARTKHSKRASLAVRWLKGDLLDAEEAKLIGRLVPVGHDVVQLGDEQVEEVMRSIARIARVSQKPVVLCLDQVDNLGDLLITAISKTLHRLIDNTSNLLVVVSGVGATLLDKIKNHIIVESTADRLDHKRPIECTRIQKAEAKRIIETRLHDFLVPYEGVALLNAEFKKDPLFPLGEKWFDAKLEEFEVRARDVIRYASDAWFAVQEAIRLKGVEGWYRGV